MNEDADNICERWLQLLHRDANITQPKLTEEHLKKLMNCMKDYIADQGNRRGAVLHAAVATLREEVALDMAGLNELQLAVYVFQEAVSQTLRIRHHIQPHWMFALDNLLRDASQATLPVLVPEFDPSMLQLQGEEESTSGVSTVNSQHSHPEGPQASLDIYGKLQRLEEDNRRLLQSLVDINTRQHDLMQIYTRWQADHIKQMETSMSECSGGRGDGPPLHTSSVGSGGTGNEVVMADQELVQWLKEIPGVDEATIDKFIAEEYTKKDVLELVTREDLRHLNLKGGVLCRIWEAIQQHRQQNSQHNASDPT